MLLLLGLLMYAVCMAEEGPLKVVRGSDFTVKCSLNGTFVLPQWNGPPNFTIYSTQNSSKFNPVVPSVSEKRISWDHNKLDLVITDVRKTDEGFYQCVYHSIGVHKFEIVVVDSLNETDKDRNRTIDFMADEEEISRTYVPLLIVLWLLLCTIGICYLRLRKRHGNEFLEFFAKNLKKSPRNPKAVLVIVSCYVLIGWAVMFIMVLYKKIKTVSVGKTDVQDVERSVLEKDESAAAADPSSNASPETEKLLIQNETIPTSVPVDEPPIVKPPSEAPKSIKLEERSVNWISVQWTAIPNDRGPVNGYKVLYRKEDDTSSEKSSMMKVVSHTKIKLDNLEPSALYHIQVRAYNAAGDGPLSIGMEVNTLNFEIAAFEMNPLAGNIYMKAMKDGADADRHLRIVVVGDSGHGKTTLTHQLLGRSIQDVANMNKTVLHTNYYSVVGSGKWELYKKPSKLSSYDEKSLLISILDFSEQSLFHETFHLFHGKNTIYLIVFDVSKLSDCTLADINSKEHNIREMHCFKFWIDSLCSFMGLKDLHELPIFFVGTHKDKLKSDIKFTSALSEIFPTAFVQSECSLYVVDNIQANEQDFINLRKAIEKKFTQQYKSGLPKSWLELEQSVMAVSGSSILTQEEIVQLNSQLTTSIKYEDEFEAFLQSRHHYGILTHFNEPALCKYIVKNPEYLLNAFSMIYMPERCLTVLPDLQLYKDRLKQEGYLENVLADAFLGQDQSFNNDKEIVVKFLQRFHLLCVVHCKEENDKESSFYIVPSMLGNRLSHKSFHAFENKSKQKKLWNMLSREKENKLVKENKVLYKKLEVVVGSKSSTLTALVYVFEKQSIATTMYHHITAAALGLWPLFEMKNKHLLCKHFGVYKICEDHAGVISINDNTIELRLLNQSNKPIDGKYGDLFRRVVERTIKQEFERISKKELVYVMHVRCLDGSGCKIQSEHWHDIVDGSIPFTDASNYKEAYNQWFFVLNDFEAYSTIKLTEVVCSKISKAIKIQDDCEKLGTMFLELNIENVKAIQKNYNHSHIAQVFNLLKTWLNGSQKTVKDLLQVLRNCIFIFVDMDWDIIKNVLDELNSTDTECVKVTTL